MRRRYTGRPVRCVVLAFALVATSGCGFLNDLCHRLQESSLEHRLEFSGISVQVPTDQAIAIGLLLNELVTNAFKYAYPEGGGGPVQVALSAESDGAFKLSVSDQGAGQGFSHSWSP